MNNCSLSEDDIFWYYIRDSKDTIELFSEDYLIDYGLEIPNDLIERYKKVFTEWKEIQNEIRKEYNK